MRAVQKRTVSCYFYFILTTVTELFLTRLQNTNKRRDSLLHGSQCCIFLMLCAVTVGQIQQPWTSRRLCLGEQRVLRTSRALFGLFVQCRNPGQAACGMQGITPLMMIASRNLPCGTNVDNIVQYGIIFNDPCIPVRTHVIPLIHQREYHLMCLSN